MPHLLLLRTLRMVQRCGCPTRHCRSTATKRRLPLLWSRQHPLSISTAVGSCSLSPLVSKAAALAMNTNIGGITTFGLRGRRTRPTTVPPSPSSSARGLPRALSPRAVWLRRCKARPCAPLVMATKPQRIEFDVLDMRTNYDLRLMQRFYDELMISAFAVRQCFALSSSLSRTILSVRSVSPMSSKRLLCGSTGSRIDTKSAGQFTCL